MLSPRLIGSSDLDLIQQVGQQLVLGWSRLVLAPCGLSSLNKLTRHDLMVGSGEVYVNTHKTSPGPGLEVAQNHFFISWLKQVSPGSKSGEIDFTS